MFHAAWDSRSEQIKDAEASVKQQITAAEKQIDSLLARIINATNGSVIGAYEKKAATLEYIMPPHTLAAAAAEITGQQGLCKILKFHDLGGTLTPPSDDPTDWWEPETLTHRAALHGIQGSGADSLEAIDNWITKARAGKSQRRATDGRPDCPYDGAGPAPASTATPAV
ncbi:hypothetical protein PH5382_01263 [Phaeobacter sp. CECT 5382]|uniref:hypothetical protein n=1 Tax=Phaeobacter sp. CECT 5382 TaxID=1712645 RepID=UPI0006DAA840|nr:hypothetical protein [Phaeobacter sp. CECT 5382]CUH87337.1 hypothetical protein PH5382_01263 [Phaeobacter sp. CECT 5382]